MMPAQWNHWAAAQYCDDWSTANPRDDSGSTHWAKNGRRYLRLCDWARRRYTRNDELITFIGTQPAPFTRIERAAWRRYMA